MSLSISSRDTDETIEKSIEAELKEKDAKLRKKRREKAEEYEIFQVHENFYLSPVRKYLKYKRKKAEYLKLYNQSKLRYFWTIQMQIFWKYIRKRMFWNLCSAAALSTTLYFFYTTGIKDKVVEIIKAIYRRIKSLFFR